ncbi:MAG TPA: hypothetical protein VM223_12460 [Planctomycetota bacterium]|nr:hypothetical protein [Planctomycetota bacterium]
MNDTAAGRAHLINRLLDDGRGVSRRIRAVVGHQVTVECRAPHARRRDRDNRRQYDPRQMAIPHCQVSLCMNNRRSPNTDGRSLYQNDGSMAR